ncbi:hypothetical protein [Acidiphilium angustum]|uniref:hypothetical protein n=1 Tax=Acidiphilium angustum TaxID=523 RepID=UPI000493F578|nr:hypothetical protein [Acidiphilium angustum]
MDAELKLAAKKAAKQDLEAKVTAGDLSQSEILDVLGLAFPADPKVAERAKNKWASNDIEFDDSPLESAAEGGSWVSAWVWIRDDEPEDEEK